MPKRGRVAAANGNAAKSTVSPAKPGGSPAKSAFGATGRSHSLTREKHRNLLIDVKTYKDTLYGSIALEPVILRLMDTPQFQRLHGLKQLGTSDHVFRGCTNTRFEHSVGVAHLAQMFVEGLRTRQPELGITAVDVMCVKIAGLVHDLGHGPYSHMWDEVFMKRMGLEWKHERGSIDMFRFMLQDNKIDLSSFQPPLNAKDITFIEEMVLGTPEKERRGRGAEKEFLYDIVNNTRSGLDVDKLDYFRRDARSSVGEHSIHIDRFIDLARVLPAVDESGEVHRMVCYPDKLWTEALALFRTRKELHQFVYQHKGGKSVDLMLVDAFALADPYFSVPGTVDAKHPDGRWKLSEAVFDCKAYTCLKDSTVDLIMNDPNPKLAPAKAVLERLSRRQLYPCVGASEFDWIKYGITEDGAKEAMIDILKRPAEPQMDTLPPSHTGNHHHQQQPRFGKNGGGAADAGGDVLSGDDLIVEFMHIHWGMKRSNPVNRMRFFSKYAPTHEGTRGVKLDELKFASFLPKQFETKKIRVFVRNPDKVDAARKALDLFCLENQLASPCPLLSQGDSDD